MIKLIERILLHAFDSQIVLSSENAVSNSIAQKIFMGAHCMSACVRDPKLISCTYFLIGGILGVREMAQWARALVFLKENLGLTLGTHMTTHTCL